MRSAEFPTGRRLVLAATAAVELLAFSARAQTADTFTAPVELLQKPDACWAERHAAPLSQAGQQLQKEIQTRLGVATSDCALDLVNAVPDAATKLATLYQHNPAGLVHDLQNYLPQLLEIISHPSLLAAADQLHTLFPKFFCFHLSNVYIQIKQTIKFQKFLQVQNSLSLGANTQHLGPKAKKAWCGIC